MPASLPATRGPPERTTHPPPFSLPCGSRGVTRDPPGRDACLVPVLARIMHDKPSISSLSILEGREQRGAVFSSYPAGDDANDEAEGKGYKQDDRPRHCHAPKEKPHRYRLGILNEKGNEEHAENKKGYSLRSHTFHPHRSRLIGSPCRYGIVKPLARDHRFRGPG